jgi:Uma2 family endonuclease
VVRHGTAARDWKDKFDLYEEAGVGEYWIVPPRKKRHPVRAGRSYRPLPLAGEYASLGHPVLHSLPGLSWTGPIFR